LRKFWICQFFEINLDVDERRGEKNPPILKDIFPDLG
jgi:hypothetical protein